MSDPCLRCGDFAGPVVEGIALCAKCLEPFEAPVAYVVLPPRELAARQLGAFLTLSAASTVAGAVYGMPGLPPSTDLVNVILLHVIGGLVGFLVGFVPGFFFVTPLFANVGYGAHRAIALERLGLPRGGPFEVAYVADRKWPVFELPFPRERGELGAVAFAEGGAVFLGHRDTRFAWPRARIREARVERVFTTYPWRASVALTLEGGERRFVAFLRGSYAENARAAREAVAKLRAS